MKAVPYKTIFSAMLGIFAFGSVAFPKFTAFFVVFLAIVVISGHVKKQFAWHFSFISKLFILFYLLYLVGILFSNELATGLKYAEYKMAFLILPLLMSLKPKFRFSLRSSVIGLAAGNVVLAIFGLVNAGHCLKTNADFTTFQCFTTSTISPIHHPSYYACFLLISAVASWWGYRQKWKGFLLLPVVFYIIIALMLYFLCLSMAGILFFGLVLVSLFVYFLYKKWGKLVALSFSIASPLLFLFIVLNLPGLGDDIRFTTASFRQYIASPSSFLKSHTDYNLLTGNDKRLIMWTVTSELILEHPFGVGTGNVDDYVFPRLEKYNFAELVADDLNPHNQYLQTSLEIGLIGGLVFVFILFAICRLAWRKRNLTFFLVGSSLAFNSLFESMWQHQSGIIFYTFWSLLFLIFFNQEFDQEKSISKETLSLQ